MNDTDEPLDQKQTGATGKSGHSGKTNTANPENTPLQAIAALQQGVAKHQAGQLDQAIGWYQQALAIDPQNTDAFSNMAVALKGQGKLQAAAESLKKALAIKPDFASAHNNLGVILKELHAYDEATDHFKKALALTPDFAQAQHNLGNALAEAGKIEEAMVYLEKTLALKPDWCKAHYSLTHIRKYRVYDPQIRTMESLHARVTDREERIALCFALGKAMIDLKEHAKGFQYLLEANRLKRATFQFDIERSTKDFMAFTKHFNQAFLDSKAGWGHSDSTPIFIVGMPRSGTTLVEQILASHPEVHGGGELPFLADAVREKLFAVGQQSVLPLTAQMDRQGFDQLGAAIVGKLRSLSPQARFITDKMPINFLYIGLIRLFLPQAKIIHCVRSPLDTCLSIFRTNFTGDQPFAYDLTELGRFYQLYRQLMTHWHQMFPGAIYDIHYEKIIADQEGESRRLLDHCGLEWDDRCLSFQKTQRTVRTASLEQVRQPIYSNSIGTWKSYEKELQPLIKALGDCI
ncbi:MAG: sulfotransferase [Magnetococcales bacterium]|nr:sulfotransferase [Magnetococcales bacterium]